MSGLAGSAIGWNANLTRAFSSFPRDLFQLSVGHAIVGFKAMQTRKANALQTIEITVHIRNALGVLLILTSD